MAELFDRLVGHLTKKDYSKQSAQAIAKNTLVRAGEMTAGGGLTAKGKRQQALGPAGRARARARKR
jgi:hypothetical protein